MNKYEFLEVIGEGTYGIVIKAKNKVIPVCVSPRPYFFKLDFYKETGQYFAIKKFKSNAKPFIKRELNMLNCLKSCSFVVSLKEAIRRKEKIYFIFEYIDKNLLQVFQENPHGLSQKICKSLLFQLCKAVEKCHSLDIIHRDIKPENLLIDQNYNLKLCDFGFARHITPDDHDEPHTEYVATRWYRSPELLLMTPYDKAVDIWAVGCLAYELTNSKPLFPGRSDLDQLHLIIQTMGSLPETFFHELKNNINAFNFKSFKGPRTCILDKKFQPHIEDKYVNFARGCLELNPRRRMNIQECLMHPLLEQQRKAYIQANSNNSTVISSLRLRESILDTPQKPPSRMTTRASESRIGDSSQQTSKYESNQIPRLNNSSINETSSYKNPVMNFLNSLSNNASTVNCNDSYDDNNSVVGGGQVFKTSRSRNGKSQEALFSNSLSHVDDEGKKSHQPPKDILSLIKTLPTVKNESGTLVQRSKSFFALNKGYMGKSEEGLYDGLNNTYDSLDKRMLKNLNYSLDGKSNKYKSENYLKLKPIKPSNYLSSTMVLDAPTNMDEHGLTKSLRLSNKSNASFLNNLSRKC